MFNLANAGSGIKKAAYQNGIRSGKYEFININARGGQDFVKVVSDTGKEVVLDDIQVEIASMYTWQEIRSGR